MSDKKPDYSQVNGEIARNWKRKKAELAGIKSDDAKRKIAAAELEKEQRPDRER